MNHLLQEDGTPRRIASVTAWRAVRADITAAFETVAGPMPRGPRCPLELELVSEVDCGSFVRRLVSYAATVDGHTPAYLCIPKECLSEPPTRRPAVLCLHGTDNVVGHVGSQATRRLVYGYILTGGL